MGRCCTNCGYGFYNGEAYYAIGDDELCEDCLNDCKRIFDIDETRPSVTGILNESHG
ncbi:hypothetical protein [Ruminococcus sp.]|uniref:hypothetical protein n=1 Tax=Ruminococcus sp. TaxID=41978 RepID=UPI001B504282|nr:hypothetical protein [Ruminococcus sp.]MBP5430801.1 hypothetical protein [Ruminococcus sp.]